MKSKVFCVACALLGLASVSHAIDDFGLQVVKAAHEDTSLADGVYTRLERTEWWESECPWFQKPMISLRFSTTYQERDRMGILEAEPFSEVESYSPMVTAGFQTMGGIQAGFSYGRSYVFETRPPLLDSFFRSEQEGEADSLGGYLVKRWDCGFKAGATVSYTTAEQSWKDESDPLVDYRTTVASASLGFARSFGEKKFGRNIFVDTSANGLFEYERFYGAEERAWHFLWMAKAGHNICEQFAVYGLFNLFHEMHGELAFTAPVGFTGYHPPRSDDTWGEAGGGFVTSFGFGLSLSAEATVPVFDEGLVANNAFQVRAGLNWAF